MEQASSVTSGGANGESVPGSSPGFDARGKHSRANRRGSGAVDLLIETTLPLASSSQDPQSAWGGHAS